MPWILAIGMGCFWFTFLVYPRMKGGEVSSDDEVTVRFVKRELMLLEAGEGAGALLRWWTGQDDEKEKVRALQSLMKKVGGGREEASLRYHLESLAESGGGNTTDFFEAAEKRSILRRSLILGAFEFLLVLAVPLLLWRERRTWRERIPPWHLTAAWSPAWVVTVFLLASILVESYAIVAIWIFSEMLGGERASDILYAFLWRGLPAFLAAFALVGSWSGIGRVFFGKRAVNWRWVVIGLGFLIVFHYAFTEFASDPGLLDPGDYFGQTDPGLGAVFQDLLIGVGFAPFFEELMFRGVLFQGMMKRLGAPVAALISTVLFAVVHTQYDAWAMISVGVFGLVACWLTWKTGSIKSGIVLHMIVNALITLQVLVIYQLPLL